MNGTNTKRAANFAENEVKLLIFLVKKYISVIGSSKIDSATCKEKDRAWMHVAEEFNYRSGTTYRNAKCLKGKYENLKKKTKMKFAAVKSELYKANEGSFAPDELTTDVDVKDFDVLRISRVTSEFENETSQPLIEVVESADLSVSTPSVDHPIWATSSSPDLAENIPGPPLYPDANGEQLKNGTSFLGKKNYITTDCKVKINALTEAKLELVLLQQASIKQEMTYKMKDHEQELNFRKIEHELKAEEMRKKIILLDQQIAAINK